MKKGYLEWYAEYLFINRQNKKQDKYYRCVQDQDVKCTEKVDKEEAEKRRRTYQEVNKKNEREEATLFGPSHQVAQIKVRCELAGGQFQEGERCFCLHTKEYLDMTSRGEAKKCLAKFIDVMDNALKGLSIVRNKCENQFGQYDELANKYLKCPAWLNAKVKDYQATWGHVTGTMFLGKPDDACRFSTPDHFADSKELEKYLASNPKTSIGSQSGLINSCMEDQMDPLSKKRMVAEYSLYMNRLNNGYKSSLESVMSINSLLRDETLTGDENDLFLGTNNRCADPNLVESYEWCKGLKKCSLQGGVKEIAKNSLLMIKSKLKFDSELKKKKEELDELMGRSFTLGYSMRKGYSFSLSDKERYAKLDTDTKAKVDVLKKEVLELSKGLKIIQSQYPWADGTKFKELTKSFNGDNADTLTAANVESAFRSQLKENRKGIVERLAKIKNATKCLNTSEKEKSDECDKLEETMKEMPPHERIPLPPFPEDPKAAEDPKITVARKNALNANKHLDSIQCLNQYNEARDEYGGAVNGFVVDAALTVGTMGLASAAASIKAAKLAAQAAEAGAVAAEAAVVATQGTAQAIAIGSKAAQAVELAQKTARSLNLARAAYGAVLGADLYYMVKDFPQLQNCGDKTKMAKAMASSNKGPSCPVPMKASSTGDHIGPIAIVKTQSCATALAFFSLNLLPYLGPAIAKGITKAGRGVIKVGSEVAEAAVNFNKFARQSQRVAAVQDIVLSGAKGLAEGSSAAALFVANSKFGQGTKSFAQGTVENLTGIKNWIGSTRPAQWARRTVGFTGHILTTPLGDLYRNLGKNKALFMAADALSRADDKFVELARQVRALQDAGASPEQIKKALAGILGDNAELLKTLDVMVNVNMSEISRVAVKNVESGLIHAAWRRDTPSGAILAERDVLDQMLQLKRNGIPDDEIREIMSRALSARNPPIVPPDPLALIVKNGNIDSIVELEQMIARRNKLLGEQAQGLRGHADDAQKARHARDIPEVQLTKQQQRQLQSQADDIAKKFDAGTPGSNKGISPNAQGDVKAFSKLPKAQQRKIKAGLADAMGPNFGRDIAILEENAHDLFDKLKKAQTRIPKASASEIEAIVIQIKKNTAAMAEKKTYKMLADLGESGVAEIRFFDLDKTKGKGTPYSRLVRDGKVVPGGPNPFSDGLAFHVKLKKDMKLCRGGWAGSWGGWFAPCSKKRYTNADEAANLAALPTSSKPEAFQKWQFKEGDEFMAGGIGEMLTPDGNPIKSGSMALHGTGGEVQLFYNTAWKGNKRGKKGVLNPHTDKLAEVHSLHTPALQDHVQVPLRSAQTPRQFDQLVNTAEALKKQGVPTVVPPGGGASLDIDYHNVLVDVQNRIEGRIKGGLVKDAAELAELRKVQAKIDTMLPGGQGQALRAVDSTSGNLVGRGYKYNADYVELNLRTLRDAQDQAARAGTTGDFVKKIQKMKQDAIDRLGKAKAGTQEATDMLNIQKKLNDMLDS
ncbi:MAG: hypothetical protein HOM21_05295 [Halobacteriovoraceae bacterium]|nr:hypothetical protein [Halobacteriovoraceae bacterium]